MANELLTPEEIIQDIAYTLSKRDGLNYQRYGGKEIGSMVDEYLPLAKSIYAKALKHRLDRPELREKIEITLGESRYGSEAYERYRLRLSQPDDWQSFQVDIDHILALIPDEEECNQLCCDFITDQAKREERESAIQEVIAMPHGTTHCDIIQALKGE